MSPKLSFLRVYYTIWALLLMACPILLSTSIKSDRINKRDITNNHESDAFADNGDKSSFNGDGSYSYSSRRRSKPIKVSSECGVSKSCFRSPAGCVSEDDCEHLLTYRKSAANSGLIIFELMSKVKTHSAYLSEEDAATQNEKSSWIGAGFSPTPDIYNSSLVLCVHNDATDSVEVGNYYNPAESDIMERLDTTSQEGLYDASGELLEDRLRCRFSKDVKGSRKDRRIFSLNHLYHLMILWGKSQNGIPYRHTEQPLITEQAFKPTTTSLRKVVSPPIPFWHKIHAILWLLAWLGFISFAIIISRYFRTMWPRRSYMGQQPWFAIHRMCYAFAFLLLIPCLIFIIIQLVNYTYNNSQKHLSHSLVGLFAIIFAFVVSILMCFRCRPETRGRVCYEWCILLIETIALLLAQIYIFLGIGLPEMIAARRFRLDIIIVIFIIIFVLTEIILEIHACVVAEKGQKLSPLMDEQIGAKSSAHANNYYSRKPKGANFKMAVLGIYTCLTVLLLVIMVIIILIA